MRDGAWATTACAGGAARRGDRRAIRSAAAAAGPAAAVLIVAMLRLGRRAAVAARPRRDAGASSRTAGCRRPTSRWRPRVRVLAARRRVARLHPAARGRRAAVEPRPDARSRRRDGPGDDSARRRPTRSGWRPRPASAPSRTASARTRVFRVTRRRRRRSRRAARLLSGAGAGRPGVHPRGRQLTSASLQARPLWDILADYGLTSGIVELAADLSGARRRSGTC